jgi:anaphase-promoting complex subunit 7
VELNDRHVIAYLLKGNLLLSSGHAEDALPPFRKAYALQKDIIAYSGLVRAYLGVSKIKEALSAATEARKLMPQHPQALSLLGLVLSQPADPTYRKRAKQCFEEALKLDKQCLDAVLGLSQLFVVEGKYQDAIDMLNDQIKQNNKDYLHTRLAEVLVLNQKNNEAMQHYNIALSLNPQSEIAKKGLERLEKIMKGMDPDHEEEEEEEEYAEEEEEEEEFEVQM